MTKEELISKLNFLVKEFPKTFMGYIISSPKYKDVLSAINEFTPLLSDPIYSTKTKVYWLLNGITDFPKCGNPKCNNTLVGVNVKSVEKGYQKYCSSACSCSSEETKEKIKNTNLERYGCENPSLNEDIKNKIKETFIERYGTDCPVKNEDIKKKIKENNLKKYGVDCYQKTQDFKDKLKSTCLERYGVPSVFESEEVKKKSKKTMLERYGCEHNTQSPELQKIRVRNFIERYGENYKNVLWANRGNPWQSRRSYSFIKNSEYVEPLFTEEEFVEGKKRDLNSKFKFKCKSCGTVFESNWDNGTCKVCPTCSIGHGGKSYEENDIADFIKSFYDGEILLNNRKLINPLEVDIVIPDKKIAIEFDGLYWHSSDFKGRSYHLNKTTLSEKSGYKMIHIFEDEWRWKKNLVKYRIKNLMGCFDKTVFARKCTVSEVSNEISSKFLDDNHMQGRGVNANVSLGLYYEGDLVSLMTFRKSRYSKDYEWELLRFCNKLGYHIPGGASKLLKYFEKNHNPKSMISYADRRWSGGELYKAIGFTLDHVSSPNYWYIDSGSCRTMSRERFQKHKLKKILKKFDESKSEFENMRNNGYTRIFDCGNMVFTKTY